MITCYDLMFYEPSTSFLTSLLWYKHFHSTFLKNICRFGNFITACMQKTQNKSGHSPSTRQNILILHQNPLQHPINALSASHVIIYCGYMYIVKSSRLIRVIKYCKERYNVFFVIDFLLSSSIYYSSHSSSSISSSNVAPDIFSSLQLHYSVNT